MPCPLCGSTEYLEVLNKPAITIWNNAGDDGGFGKTYPCLLCQCRVCGHVYEPLSPTLKAMLSGIYQSDHAQAATTLGSGNWGLARAKRVLENVNFRHYTSAVEIGCADGYALRYLQRQGFTSLVGIDPSLSRSSTEDGIVFLKAFADENLTLERKYELIIALACFEHIEDLHGVLRFCANNLRADGELFFIVPDAEALLERGDPSLFLHQHVHHFTTSALAYLLAKHRFRILSSIRERDGTSMRVTIDRRDDPQRAPSNAVCLFNDYQRKVDAVVAKCRETLRRRRVLVHGANAALNNVLGWLGEEAAFTLVDNDTAKQGKRYFNRMVHSLDDIALKDYDTVLIIPTTFLKDIQSDYLRRGYTGQIVGIVDGI